jgi:transcriptional regulator of acetoin/glycerol metabolism
LVDWELRRTRGDPTAHPRLIEACLLRSWPGNVRELLSAVRRAAQAADARAEAAVRREDLESAGMPLVEAGEPGPAARPAVTSESVAEAIAAAKGSMTVAARLLGVHRSQVYRLVKRLGIQVPPKLA